jgi:DNA (cytosine-5)-methyltransferase 1
VLNQFFNVQLPFEIHYLEENEKLSFRKLKSKKTEQYAQKAQNALDSHNEKPKKILHLKNIKLKLTENFKIKNNPESEVEVAFKPTAKKMDI